MREPRVRWRLAVIAVLASTASAAPRVDYMLHCMGCHRADGSGAAPEVPSLRGEPGKIVALPGGREYLIRVPGASQSPLDDGELAGVLNWLLTEFSAETLPDGWKPFTRAEVSRHRPRVLKDPAKARAALWDRY